MLGSCERERVHTRRIVCEAYRRRDGLWEIEATVIDEKGEDMPFRSRPRARPGRGGPGIPRSIREGGMARARAHETCRRA